MTYMKSIEDRITFDFYKLHAKRMESENANLVTRINKIHAALLMAEELLCRIYNIKTTSKGMLDAKNDIPAVTRSLREARDTCTD